MGPEAGVALGDSLKANTTLTKLNLEDKQTKVGHKQKYFAFDNKISNVKIDLEEDGLSVKTQPEIKLNEKIEKSLYTVMNELCLHFEIKDGYLKVTYNDYFSDGSIFKYNDMYF